MAARTDHSEVFVQYRPHRRRWLLVAAAFGAALLVLVTLYTVRWTVFSPAAVTQAYLEALADRDVATALQVTAEDEVEPADLLTSSVLTAEGYVPPADAEVVEVTVDGRSAVAQVAFSIDGQEHRTSLGLRRVDGFMDTVFHRWRIIDGVRAIRFGAAPAEVTVNGEPVTAYDLEGPRTLPALFGRYQVSVPAGDPLWEPSSVAVLVGPGDPEPVDVPLVARPEVRTEVERQLAEVLDQCAASTELLPPGCPFGNARVAEATDVSWQITRYPEVSLTAGPDGFGGVAMLVSSSTDGEAVVTGTQVAFGNERPFETVVPFPVSGVVTASGDGVELTAGW